MPNLATADLVTSVVSGNYADGTTWDNTLAPVTGNDYVIVTNVEQNGDATTSLEGDSITVDSGWLRLTAVDASPDTFVVPSLTLNGGRLDIRSHNQYAREVDLPNAVAVGADSQFRIGDGGEQFNMDVTLTAGLTGSGNLSFVSNSGNGTDDIATLHLPAATSTFTGNWSVNSIDSGYGRLSAEAANALGTGTVSLGTRSILVAAAADALNSTPAITLDTDTSELILTNAWVNASGVLTMTDGTLDLADSVSSIDRMYIGANAVPTGTYTATDLTNLGFGGTFLGATGTIQVAGLPNPSLIAETSYSFTSFGYTSGYSVSISNGAGDGTTPLNISGITVTGSDAGDVSNVINPGSVAAGTSEDITFDFTPSSGGGFYDFALEVASDDGLGTSPMVINVQVEVFDPLIAIGSGTQDFGYLANSPGPQTATVTIYNDGGSVDLEVDDVFSEIVGDPDFFISSFPGPIAPGGSGELEITFDPGALSGFFSGTLYIESNDYEGTIPTVNLSAVVLPAGDAASIDFGTAASPVESGFTQFIAAEGATRTIAGVTVQLASSANDIIAASGASATDLMTDGAATTFNGTGGNYISVIMSGFNTGTLDLLGAFNYPSGYGLPINIEFGEVGGTLSSVQGGVNRPAYVNYSTSVEAGKTYELRVIESGNANLAYISGLVLSGDSVPGGTPYGDFVSPLDPLTDGAPELDPDGDGVPIGIEWVVGGSADDSASPDTDKLPTGGLVNADPDGDLTSSDYLLFTYRRTTAAGTDANTTIEVNYGTDLSGWTTAADGVDGIVIFDTQNGFGAGVDQVDVYIPVSLAVDGRLFAYLDVQVAP
ncbi:hypothetical protein HAHE_27360 [Haloferula helveola]|uniref:Abnormal spindle-like microcephaly-assoc'd, ASPM-SPD-2-Hydin n=1 Tax=Haloferula helveola TaxID=490095 RepID=A0ABM7RNK6_9BACT|nr:hypothetical protein HAHE_27360 [Haloferula helveola]